MGKQVAVYDYVWTTEDVLSSSGEEPHMEAPPPPPEGETSTHVIIYTLYVSGLKQRYRHFLRQPDGAIVEVRYYNFLQKAKSNENEFSCFR